MKKSESILSQDILDNVEINSGELENVVSKLYKLYMHITPSGKRYIGICSTLPEYRWGVNGGNYHTQLFGKAVKKYGWDNIEHIIVAENLSKEDACQMEMDLIAKYKSNDPKYGYNRTPGGEKLYVTEEQEKKRALALRNRKLTKEHKKKIGDANRGKVRSPEEVERIRQLHLGKPLSEEHRQKISNSNKGKQFSTEQRKNLSIAKTGSTASDEARHNMSEAQKRYYNNRRKAEVEAYLAEEARKKAERGKHIIEGRRLAKERKMMQEKNL